MDASPVAHRILARQEPGLSDLAGLVTLLSRRFGSDLGSQVANLPAAGRLLFASSRGDEILEAEEQGGALRLVLGLGEQGEAVIDRLLLEASRKELALLRGITEDAPQPIWAMDTSERVVWANRAYLDLADLARPAPPAERSAPSRASGTAWPAAALFVPRPGGAEERLHRRREALALPGREEPLWFDVTTVRRGAGTLHFAADVGGLVHAESARLHFVQALAKTFAHLSTGLAIFDRQRRLVLFNPAFVDLTGLPIGFLSGRPLVQSVLDRLREAKILPEPRDYVSWREEVAALEAAAAQGHYAETWALPSGRTYRVTGRPHPDGALAFLFEDISDAVRLTRRLRADLDTARAALEASSEAVAVFGASGALSLSNARYAGLWGDPGPADSGDLLGEVDRWQAACAPSPLLVCLREGTRAASEGELRRLDGGVLALRVTPLPRGATLVAFWDPPLGRVRTALAAAGPTGSEGHAASTADLMCGMET